VPAAQGKDFDDSSWPKVAPESLQDRRGNGRLSFAWYRIRLTIPRTVGGIDPSGMVAVFETVVDDYAELWVDGALPFAQGQNGGAVAAGWNAPNRVVLTRNASPGQQFQIAVFAMNGPVSTHPDTFIWMRSATLSFYKPEKWTRAKRVDVSIERIDPAMDAVVPRDAALEKVADGFVFTEGPVWHPDGYLLCSDPNMNTIYRVTPDGEVSVYRPNSGYTGEDIREYRQPGSNGLGLDPQGRLTICEHGNRRVTRLEKNGVLTVLADRYQGKRLNSPNDLIYRSDGALYFSDPPFGLPKFYDDPRKELPNTPVFCLINGALKEIISDLRGPNGVALSPDEQYLYVANWDEKKKVLMRYDAFPDGTVKNGRVFFDMQNGKGEEALDGLEVDAKGNLFVSGPGGTWVISPEGRHLGMIVGPELPANYAWGGDDGRTLYMTARTGVYRMQMANAGARITAKTN
jgi:gluconolactonase